MIAPEQAPQEILALTQKRDQLLAGEQELIAQLQLISHARGNSIERFSLGTFKLIEAMGLGIESLLTGTTTERRNLPLPDSIRRLQEGNPAGRLADLRRERSALEDELKSKLAEYHLSVDAEDVRDTILPGP